MSEHSDRILTLPTEIRSVLVVPSPPLIPLPGEGVLQQAIGSHPYLSVTNEQNAFVLNPLFLFVPFVLRISKPFNKSLDSAFNLRLRIITEQAAGLGNVGKRLWHVTRL